MQKNGGDAMRTQNAANIENSAYSGKQDWELIKAFGRGDRAAADVLVERYYKKVLNTCYSYFNRGDEARDVAQEVFVKVFGERKILKFRGDAQLWTWLYRVTLNTCKTRLTQHIRLKQRRGFVSEGEFEDAWASTSTSITPEEECVRRQSKERLHGIIQRLPKAYQDVIRLIYWEDYSYREAARHLNIPTSHLGVKLMRSKSLLSKLHQTAWPEYGVN